MRHLRSFSALLCASLIAVASTGCWRGRAAHRRAERERVQQERIARDEAAIRVASADWSKATQAKDLDKTMSPYADDAIVLSPKVPAVQGKDNIRKGWQGMFAMPGAGLSFTATAVEVARSEDLAWEHGTYEFATTDKKGKTTTDKGKYLTVWKKQADGSWKVVADMDNPDD